MTDRPTLSPTPAAIACTLGPGAYADRTAWIAELNRSFLRGHQQADLTLELVYSPGAVALLQELVRREAECCAFLQFEISEEAGAVRLRVSAPSVARAGVDIIFAPFLAGTDVPAECGAAAVGNAGQTLVRLNSKAHGGRLDENGTGALTDRRSLTSTGALTSAGVAVVCGVCCALPFALPAVAMTSLGGVFATLAGMYRWASVVAIAMVAAGWFLVWWRSMRTQRTPAGSTIRAMVLATLIGGVALGWPLLEGPVIAWLQP